jgi:hypothetical protein
MDASRQAIHSIARQGKTAAAATPRADGVRIEMSELAQQVKDGRIHPVATLPAPGPASGRAPPRKPTSAPSLAPAVPRRALETPVPLALAIAPEVTMADAEEPDEVEGFSDMEGVQREGLLDSWNAPAAGEPVDMTQAGEDGKDRETPRSASQRKRARRRARTEVREDKGKGKEVIREPGTAANTVPVAPRAILERP